MTTVVLDRLRASPLGAFLCHSQRVNFEREIGVTVPCEFTRYSYATEMRSAIEAYETRLQALISPPINSVLSAQ